MCGTEAELWQDLRSKLDGPVSVRFGCGCQNQWSHFGVSAPPILAGIGMFTGGTGF